MLSPNTKKKIGLRDKAILETIIHTGLKVSQLADLNRNQIIIENNARNIAENITLPKETLSWIKKYLQTREDNLKALFINYRGPKPHTRLTRRSIERIVKKYEKKTALSFSITPEILRWAYARALLEKQNNPSIVQKPQIHKTITIGQYEYKKSPKEFIRNKTSLAWHIIENIINREIKWLREEIPVMPEKYKDNPLSLNDDFLLRKLAILIVAGKVKAAEFRAEQNKDLWNSLTKRTILKEKSYHGQEWHRKMMDTIYEYFNLQHYKVSFFFFAII